MMQAINQTDIAVIVSAVGEATDIELKMLINTKSKVTKSVILPGTISGVIRKLAWNQHTMPQI